MHTRLQPDTSGLVPIDYMFGGFQCLDLVRRNFDNFNGIRITMRQPQHPLKFGIYMQTSMREYEHFVGHVVDTHPEPSEEWVQYELPFNLMMHSSVMSRMVFYHGTEYITTKGITVSTEAKLNQQIGEATHFIKKIDLIHNAEYF